jgi:hypothetical protein
MNITRMFAFIAAVLITAVLFRVIADGLTDRQVPGIAAEDAGASRWLTLDSKPASRPTSGLRP